MLFLLQLAAILQLALVCPGANSQQDGDVKLINGPTQYQGTVAIYYNKTWGTLCDDSWQYVDGDVICRQLGFLKSNRVWYRAKYGSGPGPILVDQISCPNNGNHIFNCTPTMDEWGQHDCKKNEDAGVDCERPLPPVKPATLPVRLSCPEHKQSGSCKTCSDKLHPEPGDCTVQTAVEGIVTVLYQGNWYPVSGAGFGLTEAKIVCAELGYPLALATPHLKELWTNWNGSYLEGCGYGISGEPIGSTCTPRSILLENNQYRSKLTRTLLKKLDCAGNERRLLDCYFSEFGPHSNSSVPVATVRCGFKPHHTCPSTTTTEIYRLRSGAIPWKGRVEVRTKTGMWATVCDTEWGYEEAVIVCRALGYGAPKSVQHRAFFGRGVGEILYTRLKCNGSEETLSDCKDKTTNGYCRHEGDAGLECIVPDVCPNVTEEKARLIKVPLSYAPSYSNSFVSVRGPKGWGVVCSRFFTMQAANVVCRSTQQQYIARMRSAPIGGSHIHYGGIIECSGSELSLSECGLSLQPITSCDNDGGEVVIDCTQSLPDLVPDVDTLKRSLQSTYYINKLPLYYLTCAIEEKCLSSSAYGLPLDESRFLLRFDSLTMNWGTTDFQPSRRFEEWEFHSCHNHYHSFEAFIHYDLLNVSTLAKVAEGHKASFCLEDSVCKSGGRRYSCAVTTQGISANCGDLYGRHLDCQWIDVTDVPSGRYILRLIINPDYLVAESDHRNNELTCEIELQELGNPPVYLTLRVFQCKLSDH